MLQQGGFSFTPQDSIAIKDSANTFFASNCKAYATRWWEQLKNGCYSYTQQDSATVINYLVEVCKQGADMEHPYGSSTVKPGSTYRFKSFEEVIRFYNDSTGRTTDINCNSYLIDKPLPYEQSVLLVRKPLYNKPDTCECENITRYYNEYQSKQAQYSSFSNYMLLRYETKISNGALDTLRNLCAGTISCKYIPQPVYLPTLFQCGVQEACVPCNVVKPLYDSFLVKFPGQVPAIIETDTTQQKINQVFASYMNYQLGFSKTTVDYLTFLDSCARFTPALRTDTLVVPSSGVSRPAAISCDRLVSTYKKFVADFPDPSKGAVVKIFVAGLSEMNMAAMAPQESMQLNEVSVDTLVFVPDTAQQASFNVLNLQQESNFAMAAALPPGSWVDSLLQCKQLFEWYFNSHLGAGGYSYENYTDWLVNDCRYKINQLPCSAEAFASCDTLQQLKTRFDQLYPAALGQSITTTLQVPVHKISHIMRRFNSVGGVLDEFTYTSGASLSAMTWTNGGSWLNVRDNISFDFRGIPAGATINSAALNLYAKPEHIEFFPCCGAHYRRTADSVFGIIEKLTDWVIPGQTLWSTQPVTDANHRLTIAPISIDNGAGGGTFQIFSNENYLNQGCTALVHDLHNSAWDNRNYGVLFRQNVENIGTYKAYTFWGITNLTPADRQPNLTVNFTASRCDLFTAFVNTQLGTHLSSSQVAGLYTERCGQQVAIPCKDENSQCDISYQTIYTAGFATADTTGWLFSQNMASTTDGGQIITGAYATATSESYESKSFLLKTDQHGKVEWAKSYSGFEFDYFFKVRQASDGGYAAIAPSRLFKTDASGNLQWTRSLPDSSFSVSALNFLPLSDGGFATVSGAINANASKALHINFVRLSAGGAIQRASSIRIAPGATTSFFNPSIRHLDMVEKGSDSIIVSGSYFTGFYYQNPNGAGIISEEKSFIVRISLLTGEASALDDYSATQQGMRISGMAKLPSGEIMIIAEKGMEGRNNPQLMTARLGANSKITDVKASPFTGPYYSASFPLVRLLAADSKGNYYSAYTDFASSDVKVSRLGGQPSLYNRRLQNSSLSSVYAPAIVGAAATAADNFAIVGSYNGNVVVVRVNKNGYTGCDSANFQDQYQNGAITLTTRSVPVSQMAILNNSVASEAIPVNITAQTTCSTQSCPVTSSNGPLLCGKTEAANEPFEYVQEDPCADSTVFAIITATERERIYKDSLMGAFEEAYQQKCLNAISLESFTITKPVSEYHYTLYYYDLAGNLIKTVPPEGVQPNRNPQWLAQVRQARTNGARLAPQHTLSTTYRYNSINQVVTQKSPDGGYSEFWYDRLGRLSISRNAKQKAEGKYSYTLYDHLGRITEVGQKTQSTLMTNSLSRNDSALKVWLKYLYTANNRTVIAEQVTATVYDVQDGTATLSTLIPVNQKTYTMRNRVSYTRSYEWLYAQTSANPAINGRPRYNEFDYGTTYSYDIHGNIDTLLQQYRTGLMAAHGDNRFKVIAYKYDLISGKVNQVHYQPGQPDQLYHRYEYDAENRITDVYICDNKVLIGDVNLEEHDAHYDYYKHGPLARTIIGQQQVQGVDYAYTLQGWLKGVNSTGLNPDMDMGNDGKVGGNNKAVARDAYGFNLNYFTGEYSAISNKNPFPGHSGFMPAGEYRPLYNGNISSMAVNVGKLNQPQLYNYRYDQLNRLVAMDAYRGLDQTNNSWSAINLVQDYKERISYDANGNIKTYLRSGDNPRLSMDNMAYSYKPGTNQLDKVVDNAPDAATSEYDKYNDIKQGQTDGNYEYDAIGNLIKDRAENITAIAWSVYGKILQINKQDGTEIKYMYDAARNRIGKAVKKAGAATDYTWYMRDATGNVMALYSYSGITLNSDTLRLTEHHLYGSSRLGIWNRSINMDKAPDNGTILPLVGKKQSSSFERGNKLFELSNHLGNVLVTVSDKKIGVDGNSDGIIDYYTADVTSAQDFYPFGMTMPGRSYVASSASYRYGFNGKEKADEITTGDYAFEARVYDSRLGRFLSTDPRESEYAWQSTYNYFSNSPISQLDYNGEGGGGEKQKVKAYTNPDIKIHQNSLNKLQSQYNSTKTKYLNYYKKIGKLNDASTEADFQNALSPDNKTELNRLQTSIQSTTGLLNEAKAVQTQWNKLDREIEDVTDAFNKQRGYTGNQRLDPNLVKALMFSESEIGAGKDYQDLMSYVPTQFGGAANYQLNLGRVTDFNQYSAAVKEFNIPVNGRTNYMAKGNKNDVMLAAGALMQKLDYTKVVRSANFKSGMPWFNAVVAYKGVSAEGARKAQKVWNLYTTGQHPYTTGKKLF